MDSKIKDAFPFFFPHFIDLDNGATVDIVGHLDAVTCLDTLVAFVGACYTHKQLQMAYGR